jgi:hypothetical protein
MIERWTVCQKLVNLVRGHQERLSLTASNEGMPGRDEGIRAGDAPKLGEVIRAKASIGEKPKPKAAH